MKVIGGLVVALLAAVGIVVALGGQPASGQDGKKVVLNIGMPQGIDNMNPCAASPWPRSRPGTCSTRRSRTRRPRTSRRRPGSPSPGRAPRTASSGPTSCGPDLKWSDGQPLTAEDVAYTINRSREEAWLNHSVGHRRTSRPRRPSPTTLEVTSSVVDPKLPTLDVYIVPKHVCEKYDAKAITKYNGQTDVGLRPVHARRVQEGPVRALRGQPELLRRQAGDRRGRVPRVQQRATRWSRRSRAARSTSSRPRPRPAFLGLREDPEFVTVEGAQGGFDEFAINGGDGLKKGHPALDGPEGARGDRPRDRQADDRRPRAARARQARLRHQPVGQPGVDPGDPRGPALRLRPRQGATRSSTTPATRTPTATACARCPAAAQPLKHALRRALGEHRVSAPIAEFITGWLKEIGIATTQKTYDDGQLTELIGKGDYDMFVWGWTPVRRPGHDAVVLHVRPGRQDPDDPTNYYNDASLCDPEYDKLYKQQKVERDPAKRDGASSTRC